VNGGWIPILIVAIVMVAMVMKSRYRYLGRQGAGTPEESAENLRLREEVQQLKERVKVLERIAIEKEDTLSREIEQLRDR
jgi:hypothetical protein